MLFRSRVQVVFVGFAALISINSKKDQLTKEVFVLSVYPHLLHRTAVATLGLAHC